MIIATTITCTVTAGVGWAMDEMLIYYNLIQKDIAEQEENILNYTPIFDTSPAEAGIAGDTLTSGGTEISGVVDTSQIGYFGAFWFWLQWETGATDDTAFACVTLNDGNGGQAYGVQFDLKQGSLNSFMKYAYEKDPNKYAAFAPLIDRPWSELWADSMSDIMPSTWVALYNTDPEGFKEIQKQYIYDEYWPSITHYLDMTDIDYESRPEVVKGALMSYGHQHGPNSGSGMTWSKTFAGAGITNATSDEDFITKLYTFRMNRKPKYSSRYKAEMACALDLLAQEKELRAQAAANGNTTESGTYNGKLKYWPCPTTDRVTSPFGPRTSPTSGASSNHKGIDIGGSAYYGDPIVAAADGTVISSGAASGYGNWIRIDHGDGLITIYGHMEVLYTKVGQKVKGGETIALIGNAGISTGAHLHFQVEQDGTPIDPMSFYKDAAGSLDSSAANKVIEYAKSHLNKPYVWGAQGPNSFDCSGFVYYVYTVQAKIISGSRKTAQGYYDASKKISLADAKQGDLIFFSSSQSSSNITHIGIYLGGNQFIHAQSSKTGVVLTEIQWGSGSHYDKTFISFGRCW